MARALKVFTWSDGFHRYTVAATSRVKAMAAWETDRDLFKEGVAQEIIDGPDAVAALAAPGAVIRRAERGLEAAVDKLPKPRKAKPAPKAALKRELEAARKVLNETDLEHEQAEQDFEERRAALDDEARRLKADHERRRAALARDIERLEARLAD